MRTLIANKPLLIAVIAVGLIAALIALMVFSIQRPAPPSPSPTPSETPEPELTLSPEQREALIQRQDPQDRNPVLATLPRNTQYWSLDVAGRSGDKYILEATVFFRLGQNAERQVIEQQPFIEAFIRSTGQPDGSYELRVKTQEIFHD